jgi:Arc/MetJ-type ribon-helix-helix transcriptional regulator
MSTYRRSKATPAVREPVQVYLDRADQERLERLTGRLDATKSDVLRRGLQALEHQLTDPSGHPALRIAGILDASGAGADDAARDHDRVLAETEEESWSGRDGG